MLSGNYTLADAYAGGPQAASVPPPAPPREERADDRRDGGDALGTIVGGVVSVVDDIAGVFRSRNEAITASVYAPPQGGLDPNMLVLGAAAIGAVWLYTSRKR